MNEAAARMHVLVYGRVQMVGYRMFAEQKAAQLGDVRGTIRNLPNGATVEVVAEGRRPVLDALLNELRIGPPHAIVRDLEVKWSQATGEFTGFRTVF